MPDDLCGRNTFQVGSSYALIEIAQFSEEQRKEPIAKVCAEKTLVHELLHCKMNWVQLDSGKYEEQYMNEREHANLEEMASTLIMVRYGLDFGYFKNF